MVVVAVVFFSNSCFALSIETNNFLFSVLCVTADLAALWHLACHTWPAMICCGPAMIPLVYHGTSCTDRDVKDVSYTALQLFPPLILFNNVVPYEYRKLIHIHHDCNLLHDIFPTKDIIFFNVFCNGFICIRIFLSEYFNILCLITPPLPPRPRVCIYTLTLLKVNSNTLCV